MLMISPGIVGSLLSRHASHEQKQQWLAPMAAGTMKSRSRSPNPTPDPTVTSWPPPRTATVTSTSSTGKTYITAADQSDALLVVTRTGTDAHGRAQLSLFLVDRDTPGIDMHLIPMTFEITDKSFTVF